MTVRADFIRGRVGRKRGVELARNPVRFLCCHDGDARWRARNDTRDSAVTRFGGCETAAAGHGRCSNNIDCLTTRVSFVLNNHIHINTDARKGFEIT